MGYSFVYGSYTSTTGGNNFVRPYIYYQITITENNVNCHWWAGCDVKSGWTTNAKFTMTTSVSDGSASNRSATLDNQGWTGGPHAMIRDVDYNWNRGTSSRTLTLKATLKPYGKSASTATLSITIPALNQYTVTFNSTGGTACASQKRYYGYGVGLPKPTRVGHEFLGWSIANDNTIGSGDYPKTTTTMTVTKNITLYAVWKVTYIAPILQGNVIGYRISTETLPTYPNKPEEDAEGTYAYVQFNTDAGTNVNYDAVYSATYISNNGSSTSVNLQRVTNNNNTYTYYGIIKPTNGFDIGTAYNIKVQVTNKSTDATGGVNLITTATFNLSKQVYAIDISADSRRIAFGGSATDSGSGITRADFGIEIYGNDVVLKHSLNNTDTFFRANRLDTSTSVGFGIGAAGINHGIWSTPLNKWMIYSDGTDSFIYDAGGAAYRKMSKRYTQPSISRATGGSISGQYAYTWGGFTQLYLYLTYTTSVAAGGNVFTGTLNANKPGCAVTGVGYYGAHAIVCRISTSGDIVIRNASSSAVTLSDGVAISLTYVSA